MSTLGDIATVAAPTIVAVTALWFNSLQQTKSRDHDREMREETERHERAMRDLEYQRELADELALALDRANVAMGSLAIPVVHEDRLVDDTSLAEVVSAISGLRLAEARARLRYGSEHQVVRQFVKAREALIHAYGTVGALQDGKITSPEAKSRLEADSVGLSAAIRHYLDHAGTEATVGTNSSPSIRADLR